MKKVILSIELIALLIMGLSVASYGQGIEWIRYYDESVRTGLESNKLVLLYFGLKPNPLKMDKMEVEIWTDPKVVELAKSFVCSRDLLSGKSGNIPQRLNMQFRIKKYPTILIIDPLEKIFWRIEGEETREKIIEVLRACPNNLAVPYVIIRQLLQDPKNVLLKIAVGDAYHKIGVPHMSNQYYGETYDSDTVKADKNLSEHIQTFEAVNYELMGKLDVATQMLEKVMDEYPGGNLRPLQLYSLVKIYSKKQETIKANNLLNILRQQYPENQYTKLAIDFLKK